MPTRRNARRQLGPLFFAILVFLLASLQYLNTVSYDYAWDDKLVITANDYTTKGIKGLPDIFTKRVSVPFKSEYRPIPQALFAIEYDLSGGSPHAGHAFNILWYALTCVMVFAFTRFVFFRLDILFAFLVAVLFVVHPLHVEVVANIKGRDEILALFFGLSSVMLLVRAFEQGRWTLLIAGASCFLAACLSKSNAVTLLPLVPLVAWYRSKDFKVSRRLAVSIGAIAVCTLALVFLIRHLQNTVSNDAALYLNSTVLNNVFLWSAHTDTIVPTALVIIARYARLFLYPHPLIHLYGYNQVSLNTWGDYATWLVITALVGLAILLLRTWRRKLPLAFGVLWFAATYSVYSNLWFFAPDTMADRYMFVPSVGLAILAVYGVFRLASLDLEAAVVSGARTKTILLLFSVILAGYFVRTVVGNRDWQNDSTLIHNRIRYMENNAAAQAIYGHTLDRESAEVIPPGMKRERKAAAMRAFTQAIRIYPDFQAAWVAIGKLFAEQGIYDKAELSFLKAQRLEPLSSDAYFCLGTLYLMEQDLDLATPYLEKAVLLDPKKEEAYVMLGKAYLQSNNLDNLGAMTKTAREWFPQNVAVEALQATYYFRKQDYRQAFELARGVIANDPQNILALTILSSPMSQEFAKK
ncbi:MAG: tetratricopeptide repeat protein [Bryobacteraceae bacterium]|jgi:Tfp pilus assembly protein PilF